MQASVARCLRTPPYAAKRKDLVSATRTAYAARAIAGARLSLATVHFGPITVVPHRAKAGPFRRSSILFRPPPSPMREVLVESPGTAPGSEPFIMGAFIAIVPVARNRINIGAKRRLRKRQAVGILRPVRGGKGSSGGRSGVRPERGLPRSL